MSPITEVEKCVHKMNPVVGILLVTSLPRAISLSCVWAIPHAGIDVVCPR